MLSTPGPHESQSSLSPTPQSNNLGRAGLGLLAIMKLTQFGCGDVQAQEIPPPVPTSPPVAAAADGEGSTPDPWADDFPHDLTICDYEQIRSGETSSEALRVDQVMFPDSGGETQRDRVWWDFNGDGNPDCRTHVTYSRMTGMAGLLPDGSRFLETHYTENWEDGPLVDVWEHNFLDSGSRIGKRLIDANRDGETFRVEVLVDGMLVGVSEREDLTIDEVEAYVRSRGSAINGLVQPSEDPYIPTPGYPGI
ncbi:hypothetical protein HN748_04205 [Candidatus Peregrinibacteria bacterium]|jgi:hypothetical protein|nr:hypothetical protein [Candidatus Peregrinibacteria bacterium]MBT7484712.1 hypothetical protein [Candidatus Peregrinibacteria bacterium]MBT7703413.1 hypothetical protein [Candidatus Peregrinibacteria bacterium]